MVHFELLGQWLFQTGAFLTLTVPFMGWKTAALLFVHATVVGVTLYLGVGGMI